MKVNEHKILVRGQASLPTALDTDLVYKVVGGEIAFTGTRDKFNQDGTKDLIYDAQWFLPPVLEGGGFRITTTNKGSAAQKLRYKLTSDTYQELAASGDEIVQSMDEETFYQFYIKGVTMNTIDIWNKIIRPNVKI